jgi:creatinine amidohydrolase
MQLADLNSPAVQALNKDTPVVFPVAALEQHGRHLPLFTDSLLLGEIIRRASERLADRVLFAPLLWLGNSEHHLEFSGTLSAPPRAYLDLLGSLMENFIRHGFRRLVFINGHGGNDVPGQQTVFEVRQRHRDRHDLLLLFATYWRLGCRPAETNRELNQKHMGHACEWETSMILRITPHLVGEFKNLKPVEPADAFEPASRGWTTKDRSDQGHIGAPHLATAEKGETLLREFTADVVAFLERVLQWDGKSWNA